MIDFNKFIQFYASGLLKKKTDSEFWFEGLAGTPCTIEPIDINKQSFIYRRYFDSGAIYLEAYCVGMKYHGVYREFYENGGMEKYAVYVQDKLEGEVCGWFPNGQIAYIENYKNDKLHGKYFEWVDDGKWVADWTFENGNLVEVGELRES